jgi:hypothetical protein
VDSLPLYTYAIAGCDGFIHRAKRTLRVIDVQVCEHSLVP